MNQKTWCKKKRTVFMNTAVFVKNKEQFWTRARCFGMRIVTRTQLLWRRALPHTQGCCDQHTGLKRPSRGAKQQQKRQKNTEGCRLLLVSNTLHISTPHLPEEDSGNNSTDAEWFVFSLQALKNGSYPVTSRALLQALICSSSSSALKYSF